MTSHAAAGDQTWRLATTSHYRLLSQLDDRDSVAWMRDFDQVVLSTSDVLKMDLRALPPLTVVLFDRDEDYKPYKLLRNKTFAGQFTHVGTWNLIGMARGDDSGVTRSTIYHEAAHWLMSVDQARRPAWFEEGIAELFSTFEQGRNKVKWAKPINSHIGLLKLRGTISLAEFLIQPNALYTDSSRFYAQSWAFTHFLLASNDPMRRQLLFNFLETYKSKSGKAAVDDVFGPGLEHIEQDFQAYLNQPKWYYVEQPLVPAAEPPPLQPAPAELVETSLGFLALGAGRHNLARQHAARAIELDANAPDGHALLAHLAVDDIDYDRAVLHAEASLQRGSKDSTLFLLLGDSYRKGRSNQKPDARRACDMYENAINLDPRQLSAYNRLTEALQEIEKPREEDNRFLNLGLRIFAGEDWLRVGIALVDYRLGHREAALTKLDTALQPDSTLDDTQRDYATGLRRGWLAESP